MFSKAKIIILISLLILISAGYFFTPRIITYFKFRQIAEAASAMPWQDGGTITKVTQCKLDSCAPGDPCHPPECPCAFCYISCPLLTPFYESTCVDYIEIDIESQYGTAFLAAPIGFEYQGGGTYPQAGTQYISGGASNIVPWVIGIPP